jgi:hypothetical protein
MSDLPWPRVAAAFADSGARAHGVLASDAVRDAWSEQSILPEMTVGDVAGHLLAVLIMFDRRYDLAVPPGVVAVVPGGAGYASVRLADAAELDRPPFRIPREGGRRVAARGHAAAVERFDTLLARLDARLPDDEPDRAVLVGDDSATTLRAFTTTRVVELVVHADDLAESVGLDLPPLPPLSADTAEIVIGHLLASTRHRVGDARTIRALAGRADPDDLRAL